MTWREFPSSDQRGHEKTAHLSRAGKTIRKMKCTSSQSDVRVAFRTLITWGFFPSHNRERALTNESTMKNVTNRRISWTRERVIFQLVPSMSCSFTSLVSLKLDLSNCTKYYNATHALRSTIPLWEWYLAAHAAQQNWPRKCKRNDMP